MDDYVQSNNNRKVAYIYNELLLKQCNKIPVIKNRASMVHSLIKSYGLLSDLEVIQPEIATFNDLSLFHDKEYITFLKYANQATDAEALDKGEKFGLGYDCPVLKRLYNFVRIIAGASIQGANYLTESKVKYAINWCGGWHHALSSQSQGFCYVNDIVIAIKKLLLKYSRILYIDLDVHHGNGVEQAFLNDKRVLTMSIHLFEPGFYPCTGALDDYLDILNYSINIPLKSGLKDETFINIFNKISNEVLKCYDPEIIVVQCGADSLSNDPLGGFSLTLHGIGSCITKILSWDLPALFLGGGGYNSPNAARLWAYLTSIIINKPISNDIPDHKYYLRYCGGYELKIMDGQREDMNKPEYVNDIINRITDSLQNIK